MLPNKVGKVMPNVSHKNPHFALRIEEAKMDKLKYIAGHNGRSANKEIEQLILLILQAMKAYTTRLF